jgi:hypothetical protein
MEAVTIGEVNNVGEHLRNQMIIFMKVLGICGVDQLYVDNGDRILDANEAASLIKLEEFNFEQCDAYYWRDLLWILVHGSVFRAIAWLALHFGNRHKKV